MTKQSRRRYVGTSHMFNVGSNHEFVNGFDLTIDGDHVEAAIGSAMEPDRKQIVSVQGMSGQGIRELLAIMEREAYRARRQSGAFAVPKQNRRPEGDPTPVCDACGGRGGNEDSEGNWKDCQVCAP